MSIIIHVRVLPFQVLSQVLARSFISWWTRMTSWCDNILLSLYGLENTILNAFGKGFGCSLVLNLREVVQ